MSISDRKFVFYFNNDVHIYVSFLMCSCNTISMFHIKRSVQVDLRHMDEKAGTNMVEVGVDLSEFYMSVEWDILEVPAER